MSEHVVKNNPKKEFLFALGGVGLFLSIVLLIGISAFLRPAGEHITAETTEDSAAAAEAEVIAAESAAPAPAVEAAPAEAAADDAAATTVPADATATPAASTGDAVVATGAATATADGTVDQAAVADTDLTAEKADGDLDGTATEAAATAK